MLKKILLIIGGAVFLGVVYFLISPLFITKKVNEDFPFKKQLDESSYSQQSVDSSNDYQDKILAEGFFEGLAGHQAFGKVILIVIKDKRYIRFEENFSVTNGPDLFVYLGQNNQYQSENNLGKLKGNLGSQNYELSESIKELDFNEVWVWCRAFSAPFGKAILKPI
jgi:hypothetical protein